MIMLPASLMGAMAAGIHGVLEAHRYLLPDKA
jgi:hypothetical protein